jgi:hypothetical protein
MIRFKDISIPKPCSVDYDALPGDEVKRFCGSCDKHIYDFRGKDETYFNTIFKIHGKVCGVFLSNQINYSKKGSTHPYIKSLFTKLFSILLFLKTTTSFSAETSIKKQTISASQLNFKNDSIPIKATIKSKSGDTYPYKVLIYVDKILYTSNPIIIDGYIYLPDTIQNEQNIKVKVFKRASIRRKMRIKPKTYHFKLKNVEHVEIIINYKKHI